MTTVSQKRTHVSVDTSRQEQVYSGLAASWQEQDYTTRGQWALLGAQILSKGKKGKHKPLNALQAWMQINAVRVGAGLEILTQSPDRPVYPAMFPAMTLEATGGTTLAPGAAPADTAFSLALTTPGYASMVQIFGSAPTLPTRTRMPLNQYALLEIAANLPAAPIDLASAYAAVYGIPPLGSKVSIQLIAVTEQGFRGTPLVLTAVVGVAAPAATGDADLQQAA